MSKKINSHYTQGAVKYTRALIHCGAVLSILFQPPVDFSIGFQHIYRCQLAAQMIYSGHKGFEYAEGRYIMFDQIIFGERLKNYRKAKNYTQDELAAKIGVSGQAVANC